MAANRTGEVIGYSTLPGDGEQHAFSWTPTTGRRDLGTLGGSNSQASAINLDGVIAGSSTTLGDTGEHAVLWQ